MIGDRTYRCFSVCLSCCKWGLLGSRFCRHVLLKIQLVRLVMTHLAGCAYALGFHFNRHSFQPSTLFCSDLWRIRLLNWKYKDAWNSIPEEIYPNCFSNTVISSLIRFQHSLFTPITNTKPVSPAELPYTFIDNFFRNDIKLQVVNQRLLYMTSLKTLKDHIIDFKILKPWWQYSMTILA